MIQLIASDMDGTLLDEHMHISEENIAAIRYAQEKGIQFMVCTGRNITEALPALNDAQLKCPMITLNGAQAFDQNHNVLFTVEISKETALEVMHVFEKYNVYYEVSTNQGTFSENLARRIETFAAFLSQRLPHLTYQMAIAMTSARFESLPIKIVENMKEYILQEEIKVLKIIGFNNTEPQILDKVAADLADQPKIHITRSFVDSGTIIINQVS